MNTQRPKVITLPPNPALRRRLQAKLREYENRVPGDIETTDDFFTALKYVVLRFVLEAPTAVNSDLLLSALRQAEPAVNDHLDLYDQACLVIERYCTGRLDLIDGGTGLPEPD